MSLELNPAKFVTARFHGNIPIVLCAPHGGAPSKEHERMFREREDGDNVVKKGDLRTQELLQKIDQCINEQFHGKKAYIVRLDIHRKYIDCNRDGNDGAFNSDCDLAKQVWRYYHQCIETCVQNAREDYPSGRILLLDIHGMRPYSDYVVVGTRNKRTACFEGVHSVEAPWGFLCMLRQAMGQAVLPKPGEPDVTEYSGGYTVKRHGNGGSGGQVDAMQLEFGAFLRMCDLRHEVANATASAVAHYFRPMANSTLWEKRGPVGADPKKQGLDYFRVVRRIFVPGPGATQTARTVLSQLQEHTQEKIETLTPGWGGAAAQRTWETNTLGGGYGPNSTITCILRDFVYSGTSSEDTKGKLSPSHAGVMVEGQALTVANATDFDSVHKEWKAKAKTAGGTIVVVPIEILRSGSCIEQGLAYASVHVT